MVVLLIGGGSVLMDAMISKLTKNGHRVYLLTGQKNSRFSYKQVFEKYNFPYDSGSIKDIFESTRPDVVVFMGAYDTNFDWEGDARQESVRYVAGLVNILSAYRDVYKRQVGHSAILPHNRFCDFIVTSTNQKSFFSE